MTANADQFGDVSDDGGEAGYRPQFVDVEGTRTRYYDVGSGEPLVLLHGGSWGGAYNANTWIECFDHLSDSFRVLAFDRMACGLTDNPDTREGYHYSTEIDHARSFLDALEIETCHVLGSSRGAGLAAKLVVDDLARVDDPDRFESLIVLNSATLGPSSGDRDYRGHRLFENPTADRDPTDPDTVRFLLEQYSYRTEHITEEHCRTCAWMQQLPTTRETNRRMDDGGRSRYEAAKEDAMIETHEAIKRGVLDIPTLFLFGRNDLTVPLQTGLSAFDLVAQHNPDVRLTLLNNCSHLVYRELPAEFADTVTGFVDRMCD